MGLSSTAKGSHSELVAQSAFIAEGWDVLVPVVPTTYDFAVTKPGENGLIRVQVKMMQTRHIKGVEYFLIKGRRNTGKPYTREETDLFAGIYEGKVYVTENRELTEYWCKVENADTRWLRLNPLL